MLYWRLVLLVGIMFLGPPLFAQDWGTLSTGTKAEVQAMLDEWPAEEESLEEYLGEMLFVFHAAMNPHPEVLEMFLDQGLAVDARDEDEWTPLMLMLNENASMESIKHILKRGADPDAQSSDDWCVANLACFYEEPFEVFEVCNKMPFTSLPSRTPSMIIGPRPCGFVVTVTVPPTRSAIDKAEASGDCALASFSIAAKATSPMSAKEAVMKVRFMRFLLI